MNSRRTRIAAQSTGRILAQPVVLAIASLVGLILGLTGDGWRDGLSAILIFLPLFVFARHWLQRG